MSTSGAEGTGKGVPMAPEPSEGPERPTHCTLVNPLCPDDLCVLPYGHVGTNRRAHLLGSMYGSAYADEHDYAEALKHRERMSPLMFMAPEGTSESELIRLGRKRAKELWPR